LEVPRKDVLAYVKERGLEVIWDQTNLDPSYLRARMRSEILPQLAHSFGKEIASNLTHLGKRAAALKDYLDRKTEKAFLGLRKGPLGWVLPCPLSESIEICHLLQRLNLSFTRSILENLVTALANKEANRRFGKQFLVDRGFFFFLPKEMPQFEDPVVVKNGVFHSGAWRIEISSSLENPSNPIDLLNGHFQTMLPEGNYVLQALPNGKKKIGRQLNQQKIPAFLRPLLPHLYLEGQWVSDLFSLKEKEGYAVRFSLLSNTSFPTT